MNNATHFNVGGFLTWRYQINSCGTEMHAYEIATKLYPAIAKRSTAIQEKCIQDRNDWGVCNIRDAQMFFTLWKTLVFLNYYKYVY